MKTLSLTHLPEQQEQEGDNMAPTAAYDTSSTVQSDSAQEHKPQNSTGWVLHALGVAYWFLGA